ncbi:hypothetical protein Tco_1197177 [Tanacetum coccineum]
MWYHAKLEDRHKNMKRLAEDNRVPLKEARKIFKTKTDVIKELLKRSIVRPELEVTQFETIEDVVAMGLKETVTSTEVIKEEKRVGEEDDDGDAAGGEKQREESNQEI